MWASCGNDFAYRDALAVVSHCPARPSELVPGMRDDRTTRGVRVALTGSQLTLTTLPAKSHSGRYGAGPATVVVEVTEAGPAAAHLASLCQDAARRGEACIEVSVPSAAAFSKAINRLGRRTGLPVSVSPYTFRAQWIADAKAMFGAADRFARLVAIGSSAPRLTSGASDPFNLTADQIVKDAHFCGGSAVRSGLDHAAPESDGPRNSDPPRDLAAPELRSEG